MSQHEPQRPSADTHDLTIRITFNHSPVPVNEAPGKGYRWDRIAGVGLLLVALVAFALTRFSDEPKVSPVGGTPTPVVAEVVPAAPTPMPESVPLAPEPPEVAEALVSPNPEPAPPTPAERVSKPVTVTLHSDAVQRFTLTTAVRNREPQGGIETLVPARPDAGPVRIHAFSEVQGMAGQSLVYRWLHGDSVLASVRVGVGSDRWRSHANKLVTPAMRGDWRVELRNGQNRLLAAAEFRY